MKSTSPHVYKMLSYHTRPYCSFARGFAAGHAVPHGASHPQFPLSDISPSARRYRRTARSAAEIFLFIFFYSFIILIIFLYSCLWFSLGSLLVLCWLQNLKKRIQTILVKRLFAGCNLTLFPKQKSRLSSRKSAQKSCNLSKIYSYFFAAITIGPTAISNVTTVIAGISVSGNVNHLTDEKIEKNKDFLIETARKISWRMGYQKEK